MPRVVHFEIHADDPERAVKFYEKAFGWKLSKWGGDQEYWLATTGEPGVPGIDGAVTRRSNQGTTVNTIDVPSFEEYARKIEEAGGKLTTPKMAVPGIGYMAYCTDSEGNTFGIMQMDPNAK